MCNLRGGIIALGGFGMESSGPRSSTGGRLLWASVTDWYAIPNAKAYHTQKEIFFIRILRISIQKTAYNKINLRCDHVQEEHRFQH